MVEPAVRGGADDVVRSDLWSDVFGDAGRPALAEGADSGIVQRFALFAEVRRRLTRAAERGGLLPVLDDLQWADDASVVVRAMPGPGASCHASIGRQHVALLSSHG